MSGAYGMSFAERLLEEGNYAEAVAAASRVIAQDDRDPEPLFERATAYFWLERYDEAVTDFEAALARDRAAEVLDADVVDDAYFSALLGAARALHDEEAGVRRLARYAEVLPAGRHLADARAWMSRLRGEGQDGVIEKIRNGSG
jgi:tetratricopeptide (TPR) repeat protein